MLILVLGALGWLCSVGQSPVDTRPCSTITGGFLSNYLSPQAATEKARKDIWLAYKQKQPVCLTLILVSREGHSWESTFRATPGPSGEWTMSLDVSSDSAQGHGGVARHYKIKRIQRLSLSSNQPIGDENASPGTYRLRLTQSDGLFVDI